MMSYYSIDNGTVAITDEHGVTITISQNLVILMAQDVRDTLTLKHGIVPRRTNTSK